MGIKDETLHIKINADEKEAVTDAADRLDIPVSQFAREALREKIANINLPKEQHQPAQV